MESIVPKPASVPLLDPKSAPPSSSPVGDPRAREDASSSVVGSHEPRAPKTRRSFTVEQKRAILLEASRCSQSGDVAALLRRHGLYASTLGKWRKALLTGTELRGAGRPRARDEKDREIMELRRRVEALDARVRRAESLVELQKKAISLLDAMAAYGTT